MRRAGEATEANPPRCLGAVPGSTVNRPIVCKAAVAMGLGKPVQVRDITVGVPATGEARIRMLCASVCPADAAVAASSTEDQGDAYGVRFPCVLGHEGAGIVESVGPGVNSIQPGDYVVPCFLPFCGRCKLCLSGKTNLCDYGQQHLHRGVMHDGSTRFSMDDAPVYHFMGTSTLSEFTVVHETQISKISRRATPDVACQLSCSVPTGLGAVFNTAQVEENSTSVVFGISTVGLAVIDALRLSNSRRIIAVDIDAKKLETAKEWGATDCVNPSDQAMPVQEVIRGMTDGGVDYAFDCVGSSAVTRAVVESAHIGWGEAILVGTSGEPGKGSAIDQSQILCGKVCRGGALGGYKSRAEIPMIVERYLRGEFRVDQLKTRKVSLSSVQEAIAEAELGESLVKTIITFP